MTVKASQPPELLTKAQVAERCQVSLRTVVAWISDGDLDVIRFGYRTVRITPEALADFQWRRTHRAAANRPGQSRRRLRKGAA